MINLALIDDLTKKICDRLPPVLTDTKTEMQHTIRAVLQSHFAKLDLVTREEFDIQCKVLERCQKRLKTLEAEIDNKK